ncbi:protein CTLA-2-alpha-like isoform X2 [Styela clava]|uniref:protein CTLA-2-alpha-like n=1 Tax=Styela clava TaxID=7725 RepID=UPI00193ADB63|nr:protein CTLA-2-alpha-like [Styela clava]
MSMYCYIILILCCIGAVNSRPYSRPPGRRWEMDWYAWKAHFRKSYESAEEEGIRHNIWLENKAKIDQHNDEADAGQHTYYMKINQFSDRAEGEEIHNGLDVGPE